MIETIYEMPYVRKMKYGKHIFRGIVCNETDETLHIIVLDDIPLHLVPELKRICDIWWLTSNRKCLCSFHGLYKPSSMWRKYIKFFFKKKIEFLEKYEEEDQET